MHARSYRAPIFVFALAAWLRVLFDDVTQFSRGDELHYLLVTRRLVERGYFAEYGAMVRAYLADRPSWVAPSPLREAHYAVTTLACRVAGECSYGTLAAVSTIAGVATVVLAWGIGRELLSERAAVVGAALVALSPLQLGIDRRALQDAPAAAVALAAVWAYLKLLAADRRRAGAWAAVATVLAAWAVSAKITFAAYAPGYLALLWTRPSARPLRALDLSPALAPVLAWGAFSALTGSARAWLELLRAELVAVHQPYGEQYQSGAPHRTIVDLLALCPVTTLLALGGFAVLVASPRTASMRGPRRLAWLFATTAVAFSLGPKAARWNLGIDAFACLLAGWLVVHVATRAARPLWTLAGVLAVAAAVDLAIFDRVFWSGDVYDPTTYDVLKALEMVPR